MRGRGREREREREREAHTFIASPNFSALKGEALPRRSVAVAIAAAEGSGECDCSMAEYGDIEAARVCMGEKGEGLASFTFAYV